MVFLTEGVLFSKSFLLVFKRHEMTLMDKEHSPEMQLAVPCGHHPFILNVGRFLLGPLTCGTAINR